MTGPGRTAPNALRAETMQDKRAAWMQAVVAVPLEIAIAAVIALLGPSAAFADAFTYVGMQGKDGIVLELTDPSDGEMLARYARNKGTDFRLTPIEAGTRRVILRDDKQSARTTALWKIEGSVGSGHLTGTFEVPEIGYSVDMSLVLVGSRAYARNEAASYDSFAKVPDVRISLKDTPFEFSKMEENFDGASYSAPMPKAGP